MSTSFIDLLPPPGAATIALAKLRSGEVQPDASSPHATFMDAVLIRKYVFVDEQHSRLETEIDADDARAYHWIVHASVSSPSSETAVADSADSYVHRRSAGGRVPVGTVRLVPSPHAPHPAPGSVDGEGGEEMQGSVLDGDRPTRFHDGREAYVRLGRLATVKEYRGLGLGRLLVNEALQWASRNQDKLQSLPEDPLEREKLLSREGWEWKGLILAHAQVSAMKFYQRLGFVVDEELGKWIEEGIEHVAMWKRLHLLDKVKSP